MILEIAPNRYLRGWKGIITKKMIDGISFLLRLQLTNIMIFLVYLLISFGLLNFFIVIFLKFLQNIYILVILEKTNLTRWCNIILR